MGNIEDLGERIRAVREEAGLSQIRLAKALGVSRNAVSQWESGATRPSSSRLTKLAKILHVSVDDILAPQPALRERILSAATRLFDRVGINDISEDVICAAADVTRPQFDSIFRSREGLLMELIRDSNDKAFADARRMPPKYGSLMARIKYLLRTYYVNDVANIRMTAAMQAYSWHWSAAYERENSTQLYEYHQTMMSLFETAAASGQIRPGNFMAASQLIFAAYTYSLRKAVFENYDADRLVEFVEPQIAIILRGFDFKDVPGFSEG